MSRLMIFEPYQPLFLLVTAVLFVFAGWKLFYTPATIEAGGSCSIKRPSIQKKVVFGAAGILSVILLSSEYWIVLFAG